MGGSAAPGSVAAGAVATASAASGSAAAAVVAGGVPPAGTVPRPAARAAGRLRTESRVAASRKATPRAASPTSCASTTGVPIGSASLSATGRAEAFSAVPGLGTEDGLMVGNRPEAFPPGLRLEEEPNPPMAGRLPTGSCDCELPGRVLLPRLGDDDAGALLLLTVTDTDTDGSLTRLAALARAVSFTEVSVVSAAGTVMRPMN